MSRVPGIQIEKDSKGRPAYARINLKKHPEAIELLNRIGAIEEDRFDIDFREGLDIDQAKEEMHSRIDKWLKK